jgi:hypothetical protein
VLYITYMRAWAGLPLHLELAERARRIGCRHERRQPEFWELRLERLRLLALAPARRGLPGLAREGVDGGRVGFELALRSMAWNIS